MRSSLAVLVVVACIAVVCESAAVSKQQRDTAADDMTGWLSELSSRSIGSLAKQLAVEQKHKRAKQLEDRDYVEGIGGLSSSLNRRFIGSLAEQLAIEQKHKRAPVALETLGPIKDSAVDFLSALGGRIGTAWGEIRERQFLFQRLSKQLEDRDYLEAIGIGGSWGSSSSSSNDDWPREY